MAEVEFPLARDLGAREWGSESLLASLTGMFTLKRLDMKAGTAGGLQYHRKKDEFAYLVSGRLLVKFDDGAGNLISRELESGSLVHIPPGAVHQEVALEDCVILEVSTPFLNDRVRVEDRYGLAQCGGLPTTDESEVVSL
jgi:mannose-6-phosphate isomerase